MRFRALLQRLVIIAGDLLQQLRVVGIALDGRRQLAHGRDFRRRLRGGEQRGMFGAQQLDGVAEADALGAP
jgi:hypothetical protein